MDVGEGPVGQDAQLVQRRRLPGPDRLGRLVDPHQQRRQRLGGLVVELPRHALALVLLRGDHLAQQLAARQLALAQRRVGLVEIAGPLLDPPLQLQVVALHPGHQRLQRLAHPVEHQAEVAHLVVSQRRDGRVELARGDPLGLGGEHRHRLGHAAGRAPGEDGGERHLRQQHAGHREPGQRPLDRRGLRGLLADHQAPRRARQRREGQQLAGVDRRGPLGVAGVAAPRQGRLGGHQPCHVGPALALEPGAPWLRRGDDHPVGVEQLGASGLALPEVAQHLLEVATAGVEGPSGHADHLAGQVAHRHQLVDHRALAVEAQAGDARQAAGQHLVHQRDGRAGRGGDAAVRLLRHHPPVGVEEEDRLAVAEVAEGLADHLLRQGRVGGLQPRADPGGQPLQQLQVAVQLLVEVRRRHLRRGQPRGLEPSVQVAQPVPAEDRDHHQREEDADGHQQVDPEAQPGPGPATRPGQPHAGAGHGVPRRCALRAMRNSSSTSPRVRSTIWRPSRSQLSCCQTWPPMVRRVSRAGRPPTVAGDAPSSLPSGSKAAGSGAPGVVAWSSSSWSPPSARWWKVSSTAPPLPPATRIRAGGQARCAGK